MQAPVLAPRLSSLRNAPSGEERDARTEDRRLSSKAYFSLCLQVIPPTFKFKIELQHHNIHLISWLSFVSTTHLSYTSRFSVLSTGRGGVGGWIVSIFAPCNRIQDSLRFWIPVYVSGTWILNSSRWWDSEFLELYSGFHKYWIFLDSGFRKQKFPRFRNPD